ncbi:MAG: hypothetical protein QM756_45340 [Polyangiaceae bacterium]
MRRSPIANSESALARWFANLLGVAALVLLSVGHVLPVLHFTLVAHELCAEHGALHHVEGKAAAESPRPAAPHSVVPEAHGGHEHEHCGTAATASERWLLPESAELPFFVSDSVSQQKSLSAAAGHPSVALLSYAPKLAPPV